MKVRNKVKAKMANTFKKIIKKHKRKSFRQRETEKRKPGRELKRNMQMIMSADCPATKEV